MPNLVCIKKFSTRIEADMAKSVLEGNGIKSEVFADHCFGIGQTLQDSAPMARLMVNKEDEEKATEVLEGIGEKDD